MPSLFAWNFGSLLVLFIYFIYLFDAVQTCNAPYLNGLFQVILHYQRPVWLWQYCQKFSVMFT